MELFFRQLDLDRHEPSVRRAQNRRAEDPPREAQCLGHGDFTDFRQADRLVRDAEFVVRHIETVPTAALLLELWFVRRFPVPDVGKEPTPRPGQMGKGLGVGIPVNAPQPRLAVFVEPFRVAVLDGIELFLERHRIRGLPACVPPVPLRQGPVPDTPRGAAGAGEVVSLFRGLAEPDFVGQLNWQAFSIAIFVFVRVFLQSFVQLFSVVSQSI